MSARALIADDEAHLAEHLRGRLARLWPGLEILPLASNGLDALRAIEDAQPDVAFLDIRMPGLSGLELARRIEPRTHVVFVTAFDQYALDAFQVNAVDYLLKPVDPTRLDQALGRARSRLEQARAGVVSPQALAQIVEAVENVYTGGAPMSGRALKLTMSGVWSRAVRRSVDGSIDAGSMP